MCAFVLESNFNASVYRRTAPVRSPEVTAAEAARTRSAKAAAVVRMAAEEEDEVGVEEEEAVACAEAFVLL